MASFVFSGGHFLDVRQGVLRDGVELLVEDDLIREVSERPIVSPGATRIDLGGRTMMPGLIDAHIHLVLAEVDLRLISDIPPSLLSAKASASMRAMLMRGFTTLRDTGGADWGLKSAVEEGLFLGPRLFISGRPISQTGGHGDMRRRNQNSLGCPCCAGLNSTFCVADGVPEVIRGVREELRKGADQIKIMVSGGVASQLDPLDSLQFRTDEIEAAVEEATRWGTYVCAHAYSAQAIARAVGAGVRTIEHGNMINEATARLMAERGAFVVPTLVTYDSMRRRGRDFGLSTASLAKNEVVLEAGLHALEVCRDAGVEIGFGTDLLGQLQNDQGGEFAIRAQVLSPEEVIRSATVVNARILRREGKLGELVAGAHADILVVDGNPYRNLALFQDQGAHIPAIMLGGRFVKNEL